MARLIARRDQEKRYVFFRSGDAYAIPEDVRTVIKRNGGEFSGDTKEWRVVLDRGADVVASARISGHDVVPIDSSNPRATATALECRFCGSPYPANTVLAAGVNCSECGTQLQLVPPHVCGPECIENAAERPRDLAVERSA